MEEFSTHKLLPYIGRFNFLITIEYLVNFKIQRGHSNYKTFRNHIEKYANIAKQSPDVLKSCRVLRWYLRFPKCFSRYIFILYLKYVSIINNLKN